ncbi:MAG TPA: uracil-DNA glycosylase [Planctomycetota bacterium]|nr:uracil-DNA glycosylase [Planctomycetota bacterium]HRT97676.1 uracil-DNA glycosylase [Planctomycetota bacterium]
MAKEPDVREEYAALVRAAAARLELEQGFGIDSARLPAFAACADASAPPAAASAGTSPSTRAAARPPRPAAKPARPAAAPVALPPRHVASTPPPPVQAAPLPPAESRAGLFDARNYDFPIPEGLSKGEQLDFFAKTIANCKLCRLHEGRTQVVFGVGNPDADLMFVGEAPGHDEDIQGEPFVGRADQLLTRIIEAMGFRRSDVYIGNVNKCRPPNNRAPLPDEMDACRPFLLRQIDIIQPKVLCLLGATAVRGLLQSKESITRLRGQFIRWRGILVMPTFHPAYLLRNPAEKRVVWEDVQKVRDVVLGKLVV